jgi:molybdopterin synthase catalytic subunit
MRCDILETPLDLEPLIAAVRGPERGALVTFVGYVRERADDGRLVEGLSYEAHRDLALAEMRAIGAEVAAKFDGALIAISHRTGALGLGEAAVAIAAASAHRAAAFDACEYAIDELKKRVPIWKKEHYLGGGGRWRENE